MARPRKGDVKSREEQEKMTKEARDRARRKYEENNPQVAFKLSKQTSSRIKSLSKPGESLSKTCKRLALERVKELEERET